MSPFLDITNTAAREIILEQFDFSHVAVAVQQTMLKSMYEDQWCSLSLTACAALTDTDLARLRLDMVVELALVECPHVHLGAKVRG